MYAALSSAMARVSPDHAVHAGVMLHALGVAPGAGDLVLELAVRRRAISRCGKITKISSPQRAAKRRPRPLWPAWMITGRPCGVRGTVNGPRVRNHVPAVVEPVDLGGIGEDAALAVEDDRVVLPACPSGRARPP